MKKNDCYISVKEFIDTATARLEFGEWVKVYDIVRSCKRIDTIDAEPVRHGHWKPFDLTWGRSVYSCTNCGTAMEVPREMGEPIYNYCPECGAKMDGERSEE